jgi:hypothetical protein
MEGKWKTLQIRNILPFFAIRVKTMKCGLFVIPEKPYIDAGPDHLNFCCCGERLQEIKCPVPVAIQQTSHKNQPYLKVSNGVERLKQNHEYHYQVQGQMAFCGKQGTDFYVFSHGSIIPMIHVSLLDCQGNLKCKFQK